MISILDPIKPYLLAIKWGTAVALALALFVGGCSHGAKTQLAADTKLIATKDQALHTAADKLRKSYFVLQRSAEIFDAFNHEAQRRIAADAQARHDNAAATKVVAKVEARMAKQNLVFAKKLKHARENPDCDVLMKMDLEAKCGL